MTEDWMHSLNFSHSLNIIKMIVVWFKNILSKGKKNKREGNSNKILKARTQRRKIWLRKLEESWILNQ